MSWKDKIKFPLSKKLLLENYKFEGKIIDSKTQGDISPKSYVASTLKQMILNERKAIIMSQLKNGILNEAIMNNKFEIY